VSASPGAEVRPERRLRADAQRNRDAVLTAAADAFAAQGVEAPLEDIAKQAGVGIGTLYRHFPTRNDLVFAVYRREVDLLCDSAPELLATHDPATALKLWMERFVHYAATKRGLVGLLKTLMGTDAELFVETKANMKTAATMLLDAATKAGEIRSDITAEDLTRTLGGICMAGDSTDWQDKSVRLVNLVYDGLRFGAPASS
jgi:AcrR family transcriptional regulator